MIKTISILKGDGIGPEVVNETIKVLNAISEKYFHTFVFNESKIGADAIWSCGKALPEETLSNCLSADATLLGAIGDPAFEDPNQKIRPEQGLLDLRKSLQLYTNVRPIKSYNKLSGFSPLKAEIINNVDFTIYRELTGGIYFGKRESAETFASDLCIYHDYEIKRIAHQAFQAAQKRSNKLCLIDKANVLQSSKFWRKVVVDVHVFYPEVELEFLYVDNAAMQIILNPSQFDVILTSNMFGDIISDESSVITGSLGLLPSASYGDKHKLYEPVHGSYPQAKGKNIANPMATILSASMMLHDWGLLDEAKDIESAVTHCIESGKGTIDINKDNPQSCSEVGDFIASRIMDKKVMCHT